MVGDKRGFLGDFVSPLHSSEWQLLLLLIALGLFGVDRRRVFNFKLLFFALYLSYYSYVIEIVLVLSQEYIEFWKSVENFKLCITL